VKVFGVLLLIWVALAVGVFFGANQSAQAPPKGSFQQDMDAFCIAKLNADYLSRFTADERKGMNVRSFYSRKLHTCLNADMTFDPKNPGSLNYTISDLTYGFISTPKWHPYTRPLHVSARDYGRDHHFYAEGYWESTSSDPDQKLASQANAVKLTCDYTEGRRADDESNSCTETDATVQFASLQTDTQTYHIASWSPDEVIATQSDRGLSGTTTTTLIIHPEANQVEVVDRTRMDEKQPELTKGMAGKAFGGHYVAFRGRTDSVSEIRICNCISYLLSIAYLKQ
jgi:hypothetical protein